MVRGVVSDDDQKDDLDGSRDFDDARGRLVFVKESRCYSASAFAWRMHPILVCVAFQ